ncbi:MULTISPECIES: hypothetical protein [unclassified Embleya]|uniref:hypothetical protein n=1 Tax=unclassified Embleya TaxID=2699296 RepID=UPI0033CA38C5
MYDGRAGLRACYVILRAWLALYLLSRLPALLSDEWQYRLWSPLTATLSITAMTVHALVVIRRELRKSRSRATAHHPHPEQHLDE